MKTVTCFTALLLFVSAFYFTGCGDSPPDIVAPQDEETPAQVETFTPEPATIEPTPVERTFSRLRNLFPQSIVDNDFTTLREVTQSQPYLDFLAREFPRDEPFQTFEAYLRVAPAEEERYRPFLKKWVGHPTAADIELIHWMTGEFRAANLILFRFKVQRDAAAILEIGQVFEKKVGAVAHPPVEKFLTRHHLRDEFADAFEDFVVETEKADARWFHEQFEEQNGVDDGLLWSALRKPVLIGEILNNFSETDVFFKWVEHHRLP